MAKKGPIGKVEGFYIENNLSKNIEEIASDLNRPVSSIQNYIKKNVKTKKENASQPKAGDQFARRSGVVTMTENASMMADSRRRTVKPTTHCVVKIKEDE